MLADLRARCTGMSVQVHGLHHWESTTKRHDSVCQGACVRSSDPKISLDLIIPDMMIMKLLILVELIIIMITTKHNTKPTTINAYNSNGGSHAERERSRRVHLGPG